MSYMVSHLIPVAVLSLAVLLFPLAALGALFFVKNAVRRVRPTMLLSELRSESPLHLHAFGIVSAYPTALIYSGDLVALTLAFTVLLVMTFLLLFTFLLWFWAVTVPEETQRQDWRSPYNMSRSIGTATFIFGLLWGILSILSPIFSGPA